ncbi:hypothetical protein A3F02_02640 [Candidatus Curtissbacteria bacterium RIFCSPHIGHO2_12_FULL_38_9b]|uniref:Uncharacterized protein n=1 Tax=Candidatus Curtissbacteria bacterium RIFCSPHIGHO2_12_FULL_38_9b TaxID=1797720 RepID=A0A1F5GY03_9BACT|nr:MAG: hypothetical protein A3F02_02640 [Candidatus Curtissbacteria bacterium RIFCSPHIGHO2_12_FULL_38_9b]
MRKSVYSVEKYGLFAIVLISFIVFILYFRGVASDVYGGDSGDIILSYFFAGVPHPPGYPLNTLLGAILTRLIPIGPFAFKANLVSAVYMAFGVGLLGFFLFRLLKNFILSVVGSLVLAFVPLYWFYAHVAEVFQLMIILLLISLFFLFDYFWISTSFYRKKSLYLCVFFFGLAVFHHHTSLLLVPAYLYAFIRLKIFRLEKLKNLLKLFGLFLLGIVPYLYVFIAASRKTPINWDDPSNFSGFWQLITRADYGVFTASSDLVGFSAPARLVQVLWYFKVVLFDFTVFGVILIMLGIFWLFLKKREWFWFFLLSAFFSGPFFLAYASFPPLTSLLLGISERFLLINYLFLAIFVFFGMAGIRDFIFNLMKKLHLGNISFLKLLFSSVFLIFPFFLFITNWPKTDLSDYKVGGILGKDILTAADPPGIIFLQGDTITFNTQYVYYIDGINNKSPIILTGRLKHESYRKQLERFYSEIFFPENFLTKGRTEYVDTVFKLIDINYDRFPIYSYSAISVPADYVWIQQGMLKRLYRRDDLPGDSETSRRVLQSLDKLNFRLDVVKNRYLNFFEDDIKATYSGVFADNAFALLKHGNVDKSKEYFENSLEILPENRVSMFGLAIYYLEKKDCEKSRDLFLAIVKADESYWQAWEGLGQVYSVCFDDSDKAKEYFERSQMSRKKGIDKPVEEL